MRFFNKSKGVSTRYKAFTLAEVLITLGIIGVVAAITIPILVKDNLNNQNVVKLKKFYSTFSQALQQAAVENGCINDLSCYYLSIGVTDNSDTAQREELARASLSQHLNIVKHCTNPTGTAYSTGMCTDYKIKPNYDGSGAEQDFYYLFVLADGSYVNYVASGSPTDGGWTIVDVNGPKKPNCEGRDVFTFWNFNGGKILPPIDSGHCTDADKYGQSCAARVIKNGWQMDY